MKQLEFRVPKNGALSFAEQAIERVCGQRGLIVGMKGSLASYRGCTHWHFKKKKEKGTLEITLHPAGRRIWAQVQDGRKAPD
ncbi:MAG TPA: hypothetical protein VKW06_19725 [Candidatus Angelobacter sp.]|nr:hypothetical protein [Candidatus Angelobacter sp.]